MGLRFVVERKCLNKITIQEKKRREGEDTL